MLFRNIMDDTRRERRKENKNSKRKKKREKEEKNRRRNLLIFHISISHFRRTRWKNHDCSTSSLMLLLLFIIIIIKNMFAEKFSKLCTFRTSNFIFVFFGELLA